MVTTERRRLGFAGLLKRAKDREADERIRTAIETGWLTDEEFVTRLTPEEIAGLKAKYEPGNGPILEINLPDSMGSLVIAEEDQGDITQLKAISGDTALVDGVLYNTLKKRHPRARVFLWKENTEEMPVIFVRIQTVALLVPIPR